MALPASGQLKISEINTELGYAAGEANSSLRSLSDDADFSVPDAISDFYGYSADIVLDFGALTHTLDEYYIQDGYRTLNHTGQNSSQVVTITVVYTATNEPDIVCDYYYSINSTSTWTLAVSAFDTETGSFDIPSVEYNDVVRVRMVLRNYYSTSAPGYSQSECIIDSLTFDSGTGTYDVQPNVFSFYIGS
jgi:hypothetical protein